MSYNRWRGRKFDKVFLIGKIIKEKYKRLHLLQKRENVYIFDFYEVYEDRVEWRRKGVGKEMEGIHPRSRF